LIGRPGRSGITPATPVDLRLGVHSIGQRLAVLAEAVADRAKVREHGGMKFDVHPVGEIILSSGEGYRRISLTVNRITNAAQTDDARAALQGRLPEVVLNRISLQDTIDFFRDATQIDIRADWNTLGAAPDAAIANQPAAVQRAARICAGNGDGSPGRPAAGGVGDWGWEDRCAWRQVTDRLSEHVIFRPGGAPECSHGVVMKRRSRASRNPWKSITH